MADVLIRISDGPNGAALVSMDMPEPTNAVRSPTEILAHKIAQAIAGLHKGNVSITREAYQSLCNDSHKLAKLEAGGVDNWEGYSDAMAGTYFDRDEGSED